MPKKKTRYAFPVEFEALVVRLILHDQEFLLGHRKALDPEYFQDGELRWIVECALGVFDKARAHPSVGSVLAAVRTNAPEGLEGLEAEHRARRLYKKGLPLDAVAIKERVVEFGIRQRLKIVVSMAGTYLDQGEFKQFVTDVQEAHELAAEAASPYYDHFANLDDRIDSYKATLADTIPTGIAVVDEHLQGHGLGKGEMGILMGLPGGQKTTTLCNIGFAALQRGLKVFHGTFEVSAVKTSRRYDCRMTGMTLDKTQLNRRKTKAKIRAFAERTGAQLIVKWWPGRVCTIADLEAHLRWLEIHKGFKPDLVIADYVAKMRPAGEYDSRMSRLGIGETYSDFRSLGGKMGIPVWTAIQANRAGYASKTDEEKVLSEENCAESFEPIRDADVVITLNQTKSEKDEGEIRFHGAKVRDDASGWIVKARIDAAKYTITSYDEKPLAHSLESWETNGKVRVPSRPPPPPRR